MCPVLEPFQGSWNGDGLADAREDRDHAFRGERRVGNDTCVHWRGQQLQIPPTPLLPHLVRATVRVHDYPDGTLAIFKGPQRLASFPPAAPAQDLAA